jgi:ribosomal protein S15P/S13E
MKTKKKITFDPEDGETDSEEVEEEEELGEGTVPNPPLKFAEALKITQGDLNIEIFSSSVDVNFLAAIVEKLSDHFLKNKKKDNNSSYLG